MERFQAAWQAVDIDALVQLLAADARADDAARGRCGSREPRRSAHSSAASRSTGELRADRARRRPAPTASRRSPRSRTEGRPVRRDGVRHPRRPDRRHHRLPRPGALSEARAAISSPRAPRPRDLRHRRPRRRDRADRGRARPGSAARRPPRGPGLAQPDRPARPRLPRAAGDPDRAEAASIADRAAPAASVLDRGRPDRLRGVGRRRRPRSRSGSARRCTRSGATR